MEEEPRVPEPTRSSVLAARRAWIDYLRDPERRAARGRLELYEDPEARCCLGHACHVLGLTRTVSPGVVYYAGATARAPQVLVRSVGLYDSSGAVLGPEGLCPATFGGLAFYTLVDLNDRLRATPQQIGEYLESVIEGGPATPFRPLTDYPER